MSNKITISFEDSRKIDVDYKTKVSDVIDMVESDTSDILAVIVNNELRRFDYELVKDSSIRYVKYDSQDGYRVYSGTLKMVLYMALTSLFSDADVEFIATIKRDQYFLINNIKITDEKVKKIKEKMQEIIDKNFPITRKVVPVEEATVLYTAANDSNKLKNIDNKLKSYVNIYFCDGMYNNFNTALAPSTGYVKKFDLRRYKNGLVLMFPDKKGKIKDEIKYVSLYDAYIESNKYNKLFGITSIGDLNKLILKEKTIDVIQVSEAIHDRKLVELVQNVEKRKNIKMILIAGPSSSGKTTFAQKLGVQLKLTGYNPITISMDNYFKERKDTPLGEDGKYNFETVDALDKDLFNTQMKDLIDGKTVELPEFDFVNGEKKYKGNYLKLNQNDVLVIEGIHALNPVLTKFTPDENKYKVYIAPITTLDVDGYTKMSSSDARFLRRMVRDYATRGHSVERTFELWNNVKKGEEEYIFPFVDTVDFIYNSSLNYEPNVMKIFAQPLLLQVDNSSVHYSEARRLYALLNNFIPLETSDIPIDSIIREFIGSGCFNR